MSPAELRKSSEMDPETIARQNSADDIHNIAALSVIIVKFPVVFVFGYTHDGTLEVTTITHRFSLRERMALPETSSCVLGSTIPSSSQQAPVSELRDESRQEDSSTSKVPQPTHALDPLEPSEIRAAVGIVKGSTDASQNLRFIEVHLLEPPKKLISLHSGKRLGPRQAKLVTYNVSNNKTNIWIVELDQNCKGILVSSQEVQNVQPAMDAFEYALCENIIKTYQPFVEAMKRRGIYNMDLITADPWCVGYYSERDSPEKRLSKPLIFCKTEGSQSYMENGYARPVEGIHIVVDLQQMKVIEFKDVDFIPLPPPDPLRNYTPSDILSGLRTDLKPLYISQPEGPSFKVDGYLVEWQKWCFRVGFTPKEGMVLYSICYDDGVKGKRPIAYRLSFVEMVVPYGDPKEPHYRKNAFDAGEDGLGKNAHSLQRGCDCLGYIKYFDAFLTNFMGGVEKIENAICMHEEDHGILWKHHDWRTGLSEVRRSRRLTMSFICTIANYEYGFFWHFYQDGKMEAEVKLTGILSLGALKPGEVREHGTIISNRLYAPVHQHFFVARMNMAIDCQPREKANQVVEVNVVPGDVGPDNPHYNSFSAQETLLKSEMEAQRDCNSLTGRHWIVCNPKSLNRTGQPVGYKLVPGSNCLPLLGDDAMVLRRAKFLQHNLWVTPYDYDEQFPAGDFPNQNPRVGEGLFTWTKKDRNLDMEDIVLWYVFGVIHVPRLEDWPVMPVEHVGFSLLPMGFFDCSPAIDVPGNEPSLKTMSKL